jgi:hypothetical protein
MLTVDATLYGYNQRVRLPGGRTGIIEGAYSNGVIKRQAGRGGRRRTLIWVRLEDGSRDYFKAKDLRWADGDPTQGDLPTKPDGFWHFHWKV